MWGESRSPDLSPGSKEPTRETGPAAMATPRGKPACALCSVTYLSFRYVVKPGGDDMYYFYYDAAT